MKRKVVIGLLIAAAVLIGIKLWYSSALKPTGAGESVITVQEGERTDDIAKALKDKKLVKSERAFSWHVRFNKLAPQFKSGRFLLDGKKSTPVIAHQLTEASARSNQFTVREGLTQRQIADQLGKLEIANKDQFSKLKAKDFSRYDFLQGVPDDASLEGFLFPETYTVPEPNTSTEDVATIFLNQFGKELTPQLRSQIAASGRSIYETITVASIVEEEVRSDKDRRIVAGIIYKRLREGIRLDVDATTRYAVNKKQGDSLTQKDLESDSPYNTRRAKGLPPGPISNPGISSIEAAISPEDTDYLFYLSTKDGQTIYSKTLEEHEANVEKYLR